jgi:hypothetical protein
MNTKANRVYKEKPTSNRSKVLIPQNKMTTPCEQTPVIKEIQKAQQKARENDLLQNQNQERMQKDLTEIKTDVKDGFLRVEAQIKEVVYEM